MYPMRIYLVRGNHEFRDMNEGMAEDGFLYHCEQRLGPEAGKKVYEAIHEAFDWLPLAALVAGRVLVLHGGVGDGSWGLKELSEVRRPMTVAYGGGAPSLHALWSDPSDSDASMRAGVHEGQRGEAIPEFGPDVTEKFCEANSISIVVRSHQYVRQGYKVMHAGRLITLFSARNYLRGGETNDGAMLLLTPDPNRHLRVHPKRLAAKVETEDDDNAGPDWRMKLLGGLAKCLFPARDPKAPLIF